MLVPCDESVELLRSWKSTSSKQPCIGWALLQATHCALGFRLCPAS